MQRAKPIIFLLEELCTRHGFCIPSEDFDRLVNNPPDNPDVFAAEVYRAEGLDPSSDQDLYHEMRATIGKAFPEDPRS